MPNILMLTTDQVIDRRILLEADALEEDGWEVAILAMPGPGAQDRRVVRAAAAGGKFSARNEWAILRLYRFTRKFVSLNGALASAMKSVI
jgi:hypothetical protein